MAGFFYTVDFGKLNQRFLAHIELVERTSSLSRWALRLRSVSICSVSIWTKKTHV
ncbi:MAG: hypothetical protein P8I58_01480 [Flavobacteriaceae bacterium]|nr:hypothetical protein [Flavobacteriaceae bacterium]